MSGPSREQTPSDRVVYPNGFSREHPPGTRIDRYEITDTLGTGGCGVVYEARHVHLERKVALKLLHRNLVNSEEAVERFFREARAAAAVGSPHIVRVLDCGTSGGGQPFLAMELLKGMTLGHLLEGGRRLGVERGIDVALQTLEGVAAANEAGIVHRDLKPGNIFLTKDPDTGRDSVKVLDFGVSKVHQSAYEKALTGTGALLGTPRYMAPEQFKGAHDVDHRADQFAMGVVLFQTLSGQLPFKGESPMELAHHATIDPPRSLSELAPHVPEPLGNVIYIALNKEPGDRWPDARAFANAIREAMAEAGFGTQPSQWGSGFKTVQDLSQYADELRALEAEAEAADLAEDLGETQETPTQEEPSSEEPSSPNFQTLMGLGSPATAPQASAEVAPPDGSSTKTVTDEISLQDLIPAGTGSIPPATVKAPQIAPEDAEGSGASPPDLAGGQISPWDGPGGSIPPGDEAGISGDRRYPPFGEDEAPVEDFDDEDATVPRAPLPRSAAEMIAESDSGLRWTPPPGAAPSAGNARGSEPAPASGWAHEGSSPSLVLDGAQGTSGAKEAKERPRWVFWTVFGLIVAFSGLAFGAIVGLGVVLAGRFGGDDESPGGGTEIRFGEVRTVGLIHDEAITALLERSRVGLEACRLTDRSAEVSLQIQVAPPGTPEGRLASVGPSSDNAAPSGTAQCCAAAVRAAVPPGWDPGQSGIATVEITLPER